MAIDIVKNLNTKPQDVNQRNAQTATAGAQKMALEKAGAQGGASPSGRINVAASLGEQQQEQVADNVVNQASKANQQLVQQQGQINTEQEFQERVLSDQELQVQNQYNLQMEGLFKNYERSRSELDQNKVDLDTQFLAQNMRLQNQKYIDELNDIARRERFDDDIKFQNKAADVARGYALNQMRDKLNWERIHKIKEIDFKESIGNEDIESALAIAMAQDDQRRTQQNWQNIGSATGAVAQAGVSYSNAPSEAELADDANYKNFLRQNQGYDPNIKY